jgi:hypothetical protein
MTTLTLPHTFTPDTWLKADELDANFAAVASFLNNGSLDASNFDGAKIQNRQLAEPSAPAMIAFEFRPEEGSVAEYAVPLLHPVKLTHVRIRIADPVAAPYAALRVWIVRFGMGDKAPWGTLHAEVMGLTGDNPLSVWAYLTAEHIAG